MTAGHPPVETNRVELRRKPPMRIRVLVALAVGVWGGNTALVYAEAPRPTTEQALERIHLILMRRIATAPDVGRGYSSAAWHRVPRPHHAHVLRR